MNKPINKQHKQVNFAGSQTDQVNLAKTYILDGFTSGIKDGDEIFAFVFKKLKAQFGAVSSTMGVNNLEQFKRDNMWIYAYIEPGRAEYLRSAAGLAATQKAADEAEARRIAALSTQAQTDTVAANKKVVDAAAELKIKQLQDEAAAAAANPISKTIWYVIGGVALLAVVVIVIIKKRKK